MDIKINIMKVIGKTCFSMDSIVNGKRVKDMTEDERNEFARKWKLKHGGEVEFKETTIK